jgi:hypothetical protein
MLLLVVAFGAIAGWTLGMYFWYLRNFSSKTGAREQGRWMARSFAFALMCTAIAWFLRN